MRRFGVLLGATAPAVAAALAAFFAGLGLGGWALGRLAPRLARPLRAFAALEIATGLSALGVEPLLSVLQPLYARLYDVSDAGLAPLVAARMATAVAAVLLPAFCMGGTLPLLAQHVAANARALGVRAGGLYAVNTLGAACGALVVPAVLLPRLGATGALACAVALNLAIGIGALVLDRSGGQVRAASPPPERSHAAPAGPRRLGPLALAFVSGALTLGLEALAARLFALVHENSVLSFAIIVATFLAGLGMGAVLARVALRRGVSPRALVVAGWAAAGAWCVLLPALFVRLTGLDYVGGDSLLAHGMQLAWL
ncbi:MAG: hypothetical protein MUF56_08160, partial [Solirubrobacteraceae bacterium]|nr:hypothetical protein [Solirubrobacteraceae bacterium]